MVFAWYAMQVTVVCQLQSSLRLNYLVSLELLQRFNVWYLVAQIIGLMISSAIVFQHDILVLLLWVWICFASINVIFSDVVSRVHRLYLSIIMF